jgi:serine protease Do
VSRGMQWGRLVGLMVAVLLLAVACHQPLEANQQSGDNQREGTTKQGGASDDLVVHRLTDVDEATVYIEAVGGFRDVLREVGESPEVGTGSAFIISPDGLALTNNHVVTGSAYLDVYVGGEEDPRRAEILGVSECSDLALIDIDGSNYPYLKWRDEPIEAGLQVYAAGYPEDPENPYQVPPPYRITEGSIETDEASGETALSSVQSVIEHSAVLRRGNSGGPLVDKTAKVVGVNYRTALIDSAEEISERNLAIARDEAQSLVNRLETGNVDSIGVNGQAISEGGAPTSGLKGAIAVYSVQTGTPSEKVGVRGLTYIEEHGHYIQDFITHLEGTDLALGGTMEEYCNILRAHNERDPISIEVERVTIDANTGELIGTRTLTGVLNQSPLKEEVGVPHEQGNNSEH